MHRLCKEFKKELSDYLLLNYDQTCRLEKWMRERLEISTASYKIDSGFADKRYKDYSKKELAFNFGREIAEHMEVSETEEKGGITLKIEALLLKNFGFKNEKEPKNVNDKTSC